MNSPLHHQALVLQLLTEGPRHGYGLAKDVTERTGLELRQATFYEVLRDLESQGLAERFDGPGRRILYRLTPAGNRCAQENAAFIAAIFGSS